MSLPSRIRTTLLFASVITALLGYSPRAFALNILLTNDDGLTSNLKALYEALKADGHDVIVSVPCTGQSGRGAAIVMYSPEYIIPDDDKTQIEAEGGCHNGAAPIGAPAVGRFTKPGYDNNDYYYVHGTPVLATLYGLDVLSQIRWNKAPDLVISGPNEGQNVGKVVNSSGTVGNAQAAAARGLPAIAVSAGSDTVDNQNLANPYSKVVAQLTVKLVKTLQAKADEDGLLAPGIALNVNVPNAPTSELKFAFSRFGSFEVYSLKFKGTAPYGLTYGIASEAPTRKQAQDESVVFQKQVSVTAMQVGFEAPAADQLWLSQHLSELFNQK